MRISDWSSDVCSSDLTWVASQKEWFYSSIIDLDVDGKVQKVLLRDMQRHPYKQLIMHLDFQRVNQNEAIRMSVPLHFVNGDISPAGKAGDVVIMHELTEVAISCLRSEEHTSELQSLMRISYA